jgi:hypothetical protein
MLEKPEIPDERILACLRAEYGLLITRIDFLPLGQDLSTAVYRAVTQEEMPYFCRLKRAVFDPVSVVLPHFLSEQSIPQIILPLVTRSGDLWAVMDEFHLILYPFVDGTSGYELELTERQMALEALRRAEELAQMMAFRSLEFVLCHSDIHPGNLFIDGQERLFIVDWDYPMLAPKERDLMFIGSGEGYKPYIAAQEERLFYQGYGQAQIDPLALAYYRCERVITDLTVECERILSETLGEQDRANAFETLQLYFLPGCTVERALASNGIESTG